MLPKVEAFGIRGPVELHPQISKPVTHLERLWAYLSVKQLLDARAVTQNKTRLEKEALALALKYSFVTPLTSLVVVKPNSTNRVVNAIPADRPLLPTPVFLTNTCTYDICVCLFKNVIIFIIINSALSWEHSTINSPIPQQYVW